MRRATETQPVRVTVHTEAITEHDDMPHTAVFADHSLDVKSSPGDVMQMSPIRLPKEQAESIRDSHSSV
ncbi:hypothetical protein VKT23_005259 [Stygiomarasmius scandens]|uniref:Uncharacterized protein n=1 Tax=Marasmiellus scandens TaxID=2682957 RepID=A0ABR1JPK9_9AGAR